MTNKKHDEFEKRNVKWRNASSKAIDLRYALEDILSSFSEEEKQSIRYKQFIETISQQYDHLLGDINKNKQIESQEKLNIITNKNKIISFKTAIIASTGAIALKIIEIIPSVLSAIFTAFGGKP